MIKKELLKEAIQATDHYLGIEKNAIANGLATSKHLHDFNYHFIKAQELLNRLGILTLHEKYMSDHAAYMNKLSGNINNSLVSSPIVQISTAKSYVDERFKVENLLEKTIEKELTDKELEKLANELDWEDIIDFYNDDELIEDDDINEAISPTSRIQRRMRFARTASKRNAAKMMKLLRASDVKTLQLRAQKAARRALMRRFLRGRNKALMSAQEKSQIEAQVNRLKAIQSNLAVKMLPRIREIEKNRLVRK
jgi:hypothetical protein